ncbi:digestive organ expansion factor homolog [Drosophila busckii]|uniref:digestive organ expansion factor homolog n=1 Tax=Drosophila busckii TaxID=30019 RepID=UPI00083ECE2A|nr:digestive organ expansion factor homolog [Drosophila busckii]
MRKKHSKMCFGVNKKAGAVRKSNHFAKNNNFMQRSRTMEKKNRTEISFRNEFNQLQIDVADPPSLNNEETGFYEQLVNGYHGTNSAISVNELDKCFPMPRENKTRNDSEDVKYGDLEQKPFNTFAKRFNYEITADDIPILTARKTKTIKCKWAALGNFKVEVPDINANKILKSEYKPRKKISCAEEFQSMEVKRSMCTNVSYPLTQLQTELFQIVNNYLDLYYPQRIHDNAESIRYVYCLHALNHMLKSRSLILRNNEKVNGLSKSTKRNPKDMAIPDSFRDQGLSRMKILIVLPFRDSVLKTVNIMAKLLDESSKGKYHQIAKYERFLADFSGNTVYLPKTNPKPHDYEQTFSGNTDDNFKIGIRLAKKTLSLYTDINNSDILIASPLALRMIINDKDQSFDFLNSIELLIIDQAELFLAQNWENLIYTLDHLHLQPQSLPDIDCQRIRASCLSGTSRFYRQTLFFSSHELPEFRGLFNNKCDNYQGKARIANHIEHGDIRNVLTPIQQIFQRIDCSSAESAFDDRFQYFVRNIVPQFSKSIYSHCLLYVPSYFDYIRLRNHFKSEMVNFVQISEYTKKEKISRARDIFFHSGAKVMLYSERAHFFRRTRIKGVRHLIMYQPPNFPNFYSEIINLMLESSQNPRDGLQDAMSVKILYTKYDLLSLSNIVGNENALKLSTAANSSYMFSNSL